MEYDESFIHVSSSYIYETDSSSEEDDTDAKELVRKDCLEKFSRQDFIMEPDIVAEIKRFFQYDGMPDQLVQLLSDNYNAIAKNVNLFCEWLVIAGMKRSDVEALVVNNLKAAIIKNFDSEKADSIFTEDCETPVWLHKMIESQSGRSLIYKLVEDHPHSLMLNYSLKLISDAGLQREIHSIGTASCQLEVFSDILKASISNFLEGGEEKLKKNLHEYTRLACHGEHTYLYSQILLHSLAKEPEGGSNIKRLYQETCRYVQESEHIVAPIAMALDGAPTESQAYQALSCMLHKNTLNPADITRLYKMYERLYSDCR